MGALRWNPREPIVALWGALAFGLLAGCADAAIPAPASDELSPERKSVIVGLTSDFTGDKKLDRMHVLMRVEGVAVVEKTMSYRDPSPPSFPMELAFVDVADGARVEILLEGFGELYDERPVITRSAATSAVEGRTLLLPVRLERECIPGYRVEGDEQNTPECHAPETCIAAACQDPYVAPDRLLDYAPSWATEFADACKPLDPGDPVVVVGQGIDAYAPVEEGDTVNLERGPQGGFHVWVALRMQNLHQAGSITTLSAEADGIDLSAGTFDVPYGYEEVPGGSCELHGLRYQFFFGNDTVPQHYGDEVRLIARVVDLNGDEASGEKRVVLGPPP